MNPIKWFRKAANYNFFLSTSTHFADKNKYTHFRHTCSNYSSYNDDKVAKKIAAEMKWNEMKEQENHLWSCLRGCMRTMYAVHALCGSGCRCHYFSVATLFGGTKRQNWMCVNTTERKTLQSHSNKRTRFCFYLSVKQ